MPKVRISKIPNKYNKPPQNDVLGEYVKKQGGCITCNKKGGSLQYPFQQDMGGVIVPMHVPDMDGNMYAGGGPLYQVDYHNESPAINFQRYYQENFENGGFYDQNLIGTITDPNYMKKGGWLKHAVNPAHKGYCTPMTKSTCTGHRRAFALMMKKKHGFHKKENGGYIEEFKKGGNYIGAGPNTDLNPTTNSTVTDYNPYIYFKNKNWYITSNPEDASITGSLKPIDRSVANIEAEKGEYLVKPGLTGLYKITGEKHSQGGTPLYAEGGSFIFSNDPKLSFTRGERESFGFKPGVSNSRSKNTPAKVLGREINPKDYNAYIATLTEPKTDRIAKTTAGLMLEKLQQKLGQIAYLQEAKKDAQIPDFAQGTAPEKQPQFDDIGEKMSEYAVGGYYPGGGAVDPYTGLPIDPSDQYPGGKTTLGRITPTGLANNFNYPGGVQKLIKDWQAAGVDLTNLNSRDAQGAMYDWALQNNPGLIRGMWSKYGDTALGKKLSGNGKFYDFEDLPDQALENLRGHYTDNLLGARVFSPTLPNNPMKRATPPGLAPVRPTPNVQLPPNMQPSQPGQPIQTNPTLPYQIKGKLTDSQLSHLGYLGLQAFNINRYYPKRDQISLPEVRLDQINEQPYINSINNQAYEARELASLNPRTAGLVGSNVYGTALDQISQVRGNINNQNVQIGNQQNLTNLQQRTNQVMYNNQADANYYNQVQATNQNFDNERRFASNQFMSTLNGYQSQADQLAWGLAAVNKYGMRKVVDPKTGQTYNLPTPLYEATGRGINYNADVANIWMANGANRINTPQELAATYQHFRQSGIPDLEAQRLVSALIRARGTQVQGQGPFYTNNPYGPLQ